MKVLILSSHPWQISDAFIYDEVTGYDTDPLTEDPGVDWIISYGYRHIIKPPILDKYAGRIVNIHIGFLPWNRGADPNFWSWYDDTPKGIAIHLVDGGVDTGDILTRVSAQFSNKETLRTSYFSLQTLASRTFCEIWPSIRCGLIEAKKQESGGSYHRAADKEKIFSALPLGLDTPVRSIEELGRISRGEAVRSLSVG